MTDKAPSRPNIVVILVDDMGFSDIGCYGSEIRTPALDRLAADGVRFTQMYNCARCCPTRASLLTGLYPHQAGVGHMVDNKGFPAYQGFLRDDCVTIAEALRDHGYQTLMSGKWHVGGSYRANEPQHWHPGDPDHPTPVQRGFDRYDGMLGGAGSYFHPPFMLDQETLVFPGGDDYYLTDDITDHAVRMIADAAAKPSPFFLYVAYTAPHWPLHARPEDIARHDGVYRGGWDAIRAARHEKLKGLGLVDSRWPISPRDTHAPPWPDIPDKDWEALRMAVYAAQVDRMDQGVGRVMAALRERRLEDNTLVLFLSDNGGCAEFLAEDTRKPKPHRYNIPMPDGRPMRFGNDPLINPGPDDTFASYDLPWANVSNTPFRLYKSWVHEGGIATPLIAHWPAAVPKNLIVREPTHVADIMATCLDAAGAGAPRARHGKTVTPLEGESFLRAIAGGSWKRERPLFFEHEGNRAVRDDSWKLVSRHSGRWELYNMEQDRTESADLADTEKARVRRMTGQYRDWAARCGVLDWPITPRTAAKPASAGRQGDPS